MYASQLDRALSSAFRGRPILYLGVFDLDSLQVAKLRSITANEWFLALHKDNHWMALWHTKEKTATRRLFFLDPLAKDFAVYSPEISLRLQLLVGADNFYHLPFPVQSQVSLICGLYIIYFALVVARGGGFCDLFAPFRRNEELWNDSLVRQLAEFYWPQLNLQQLWT